MILETNGEEGAIEVNNMYVVILMAIKIGIQTVAWPASVLVYITSTHVFV